TLTSGRYVGSTQVVDNIQPGVARERRTIANLHGQPALRSMQDGLPVESDHAYEPNCSLREQLRSRSRVALGQFLFHRGETTRPRRPVSQRARLLESIREVGTEGRVIGNREAGQPLDQ